MTRIIIPESVKEIGNGIFRSCTTLTSAVFMKTDGWKEGGADITVTDETNMARVLQSSTALTRS